MIGPIDSGGLYFLGINAPVTPRTTILGPHVPSRIDALRPVRRAILDLRLAIENLRQAFSPVGRQARVALARSSADLGLGPVGTRATLTSTEELNTTPTSFSPYGPSFAGPSTAEATLRGVYDGSDGTDTLTFEVKRGDTVGSNQGPIKFDVLDGTGRKIDSFNIQPNSPAGTEVTLDNGLIVSFSAGELNDDDTFTVDVFANVGTSVDPDNPFDGTRNDNARLEPGAVVTAGTFEVNGVTIDVSASDTLNEVLDRITASGAGVTATFDAATETVRLTQDSAGSAFGISVGNDTSGFLAAAKLSGAATVPGTDGTAEDEVIANVPGLEAVTSGTATVNGIGIAIDVQTDSLNDVLARINGSGAGVTASLDAAGQRVALVSSDPSSNIVLDDGDTALFTTLNIAEGVYEPTPGRAGLSAGRISRLFDTAADAFNALFRQDASDPLFSGLKGDLRSIVERVFGREGPRAAKELGIRFDFNPGSRQRLDFDSRSAVRFRAALRTRPSEVRDLFLKPAGAGGSGLLDELIDRLRQAEQAFREGTRSLGSVLDVVA